MTTYTDGTAPATGDRTESQVAGVWAEVLNLDEVGPHDDFFDLGGHSLLATQVVVRLREVLGVDVPERALFDWPTVAGLARAVPGYPPLEAAGTLPPLRPRAR